MKHYLAIDIGASSGRHIVGCRDGGIQTDEVYRFNNGVKNAQALVWDIDELTENVIIGIKEAIKKYPDIDSLAIDTWGVDYVLLNGSEVIAPCYSYRDSRTEKIIDRVHGKIPFSELYSKTGIQFQPFNSIYQLYDDLQKGRLQGATDFLMIPEYLNYVLTGVKMHEYTNATTTGLVNAATGAYDMGIISKLGLPERLFGKLYSPGTLVGKFKPDVEKRVGGNIKVVLCASHDTASAVEGIPMADDALYISSGTWSLLGVKADKAITDENSQKANYSNEGGVGYTRYQKNIMGMWVVNRLRAELCPDKPWDEITAEAIKSAFTEWVDINDKIFLSPDSMKEAFDYMVKAKPQTTADYFNCAYISLAHGYKQAIEELQHNTNKTYSQLYIVGGGAKNKYLNALTEKICNIKVIALPIEATAIGNLKIQLCHSER
ncbi:MAG: rhamnulokinase [Clostridiales bacterium]|nr:rhamnulokinase [Clostridiales bacterium]